MSFFGEPRLSLPSMHLDKTWTLYGCVPSSSFLVSVGPSMKSKYVCKPLGFCRCSCPPTGPSRDCSGTCKLFWASPPCSHNFLVCNALPLPSLSGRAIYSSGAQIPLFPPAGNLVSSLAPYSPVPCLWSPRRNIFQSLKSGFGYSS